MIFQKAALARGCWSLLEAQSEAVRAFRGICASQLYSHSVGTHFKVAGFTVTEIFSVINRVCRGRGRILHNPLPCAGALCFTHQKPIVLREAQNCLSTTVHSKATCWPYGKPSCLGAADSPSLSTYGKEDGRAQHSLDPSSDYFHRPLNQDLCKGNSVS